LQEARRQACVAIDFYNQPGDKRSLADFVVHMHLAWQNMLHADLERRGVNIYFREKNLHQEGIQGFHSDSRKCRILHRFEKRD
jgi:hypothetical protein